MKSGLGGRRAAVEDMEGRGGVGHHRSSPLECRDMSCLSSPHGPVRWQAALSLHVEASGEVETTMTRPRLRKLTLASHHADHASDATTRSTRDGEVSNAGRRSRRRAASSPLPVVRRPGGEERARTRFYPGWCCVAARWNLESRRGRQTELVARARVLPRLRARAARARSGRSGARGDDLRAPAPRDCEV